MVRLIFNKILTLAYVVLDIGGFVNLCRGIDRLVSELTDSAVGYFTVICFIAI